MTFAERMALMKQLGLPDEKEMLDTSLVLPTDAEKLALGLLQTMRNFDANVITGFAASLALAVRIGRQVGVTLPQLQEAVETRWKSRHADGLMIR
jgi:hypothetical protein